MNTSSELKRQHNSLTIVKNTMLGGLICRLAVLIFMFTLGIMFFEPYFITDDQKYERLAETYMLRANGVFDFELFDSMTRGYLHKFWPFVECFFAKIFNNIYAARVVNILMSTVCIWVIYNLTYVVSQREDTALRAAKIFAYLPITVLTSCFPIKDIYISLGVLYGLYTFICIQKGEKISRKQVVLCVALLVGVYLTRGAVVELLLFFFAIYYLQELIKAKKDVQAIFLFLAIVVVLIFFSDDIFASFEDKIDDYSGYAGTGDGIEAIRFTGLRDIYKLPLAYAFATLQPSPLDFFATGEVTWLTIMSYANISFYPIAIGNFFYMFSKKHNFFFWVSTFAMFSGVIMLSLGIFRHYLFMLPVTMINHSLYIERDPQNNRMILLIGAFSLFFFLLVASALNIF